MCRNKFENRLTKPQILFLTFLHPRTFIQPIFSCTSVSSVGLADGRGVVLLHRGRPLRRGLRRAAFCAVVYAAVLSLLLQPMPPGLPLDLAYLSCPLLRSSLVLRSLYLTQSYLLPAPLYSTAASGIRHHKHMVFFCRQQSAGNPVARGGCTHSNFALDESSWNKSWGYDSSL